MKKKTPAPYTLITYAKKALIFWDDYTIDHYEQSKPESLVVSWHNPAWRDKCGSKGIDPAVLDKLIDAGYLEYVNDDEGDLYLTISERGFRIVYYYRPASHRQMPVWPVYLDFIQREERIKYYQQQQGLDPWA